MLDSVLSWLNTLGITVRVFVLSGFAAVMTGFGGLLIYFIKVNNINIERIIDIGLGFSSGVMIVASFTSLLIPAINYFGTFLPLTGFILGSIFIHIFNYIVPHEHFVRGYEGPKRLERKIKTAWLVALAIIIHNFPEGMTIGASSLFSLSDGFKTSIAIGLQDIPEGLAVALPIVLVTKQRAQAVFLAFLSGLSEVLTALLILIITFININILLPLVMGAGAGAMIYVVSHEAIPESHRSGHENEATLGLFIGFITMLLLDTLLS